MTAPAEGAVSRYATIADAAHALRAGEVTSVELVREAAAAADACDEQLGIFVNRFPDTALATAREIDELLADGQELGPLAGIPIAVKDLISTSEAATTAQSLVLDPAWSNGDAPAVSRLRAADSVIMGKTTTMEFAIGAPDPGKPFAIPRNPWDPDRWTGGSSSGSASAVAVGAALGALGTDAAGSIRSPAAYCGITGLMPTFGRVPKTGCVPLGYTLDHVGPMARSARDCALLLQALAGYSRSDPTAIDTPVPDYVAQLTGDLDGVRIGVDRLSASAGDAADPAMSATLDAALDELRGLGAEIIDVEVPMYVELTAACVVIMLCESLAYHQVDLQSRWHDYFASTRAMIASGVFYSAADYLQAQRVRRVGMRRLAALFGEVDLVVTPTASVAAPTFVEIEQIMSGAIGGDLGAHHAPYWDAPGNPVLSVPIGYNDSGLPLGMQVAGRPFDEGLVLRAGDAYQWATRWHLDVPTAVADTATSVT